MNKAATDGDEVKNIEKENNNQILLKELGLSSYSTKERFTIEGDETRQQDEEARPEDIIPDLPENSAARDFLKKAPSKGLYMPMGKEVKVMQCFRCKAYGHRTNDRECPLSKSGNLLLDSERQAREDPMSRFVALKAKQRQEKYERVLLLKRLVDEIRVEEAERKRQKKEKKVKKESKKKHDKKDKKEKKSKTEKS